MATRAEESAAATAARRSLEANVRVTPGVALPIGTVKSRTFAAMRALRDALAAAGMHPEDEWNTSTS